MSAPWFILVAGINGAGKSTFSQDPEVLRRLLAMSGAQGIEVINPDDETKQILAQHSDLSPKEANVRAAERCEDLVRQRIEARQSHFVIETVLSTNKYRAIVESALQLGWQFLLVYIALDSVDEAVARVAQRVSQGGHSVPKNKIRKRWGRSRKQVPWFWLRSTRAVLFRNPPDFAAPEILADKRVNGSLELAAPSQQPACRKLVGDILWATYGG